MMQNTQSKAPRLSRLQEAWLQEIGLDRRMLAHYVTTPADAPVAASAGERSAQLPVQPKPQSQRQPTPQSQLQAKPQASGLQAARELLRTPPQPKSRRSAPEMPDVSGMPRQPAPHDWKELLAHIAQCQAC